MALLDEVFTHDAADPKWVKNARGHFHAFTDLDPEAEGLSGASGVFVIWHKGVKPAWVYVGRSNDLARTFHEIGGDDDVMHNEVHGGLYVTWSLIRGEFQDGVVKYLTAVMKPKVENPAAPGDTVKPVPVRIPT